jgi:hypothetical protein
VMRFNQTRLKRQHPTKSHTYVPFVVARCNLEARSYHPKAGRHHERHECGFENSPFQSAVLSHGVPALGFLETQMDRPEVLDSDPQLIAR